MRQAGSHFAHRAQPRNLREFVAVLLKLLFNVLQFGDVVSHANSPDHLTGLVHHRKRPIADPANLAVGTHHAVLLDSRQPARLPSDLRLDQITILRHDDIEKRRELSRHHLSRPTEDRFVGRADVVHAAVIFVVDPEGRFDVFSQLPESLFVLFEQRFRTANLDRDASQMSRRLDDLKFQNRWPSRFRVVHRERSEQATIRREDRLRPAGSKTERLGQRAVIGPQWVGQCVFHDDPFASPGSRTT